jgi:hypothetical protein
MAHISRTRATFRIGADPFEHAGVLPDASLVTRTIGIQPSRSHNPGDRQGPKAAPFKNGQWSLRSPLAEDSALELHLTWLLERLLPVREKILEVLDGDTRLSAYFFCGLWLTEFNEGLELTPATLDAIGSLRATLGLDIYQSDEDDS